MAFLAPSTGPVNFPSILEVSPISLDRCVTHQAGSYSPRTGAGVNPPQFQACMEITPDFTDRCSFSDWTELSVRIQSMDKECANALNMLVA